MRADREENFCVLINISGNLTLVSLGEAKILFDVPDFYFGNIK